ncbi:ATP-grasp domain-containing protein [Bartonella senegalensis]|uniref:ATP-grasp domain-containing protein n=1 Tax=Bartonella senegalensis TaxID=1468418 RepID=UPI0002DB9C86|nr:ATP-grasp domain-containing protein [Bartonella senegalensis]
MTIRVLLLDRNKVHVNQLIQSEEYKQFSFIFHKSTDVIDNNGCPIGFTYHTKTLAYLDHLMCVSPFEFVVSCSESQIQFAGLLRMRYGLKHGFDILISANVSNKLSMRQRLSNYVLSPKFWHSGDFLQIAHDNSMSSHLPKKVVIKPIYGSSTQGVQCFTLHEAIEYLEKQFSLFIVEDYIPLNRELHCDGVIVNGHLNFFLFSQYARPWLSGQTKSNASIHLSNDDPQYKTAKSIVMVLLRELGIQNGVFHIELFDYNEKLYFGEIALRPSGGGLAYSIQYFFDINIWDCYLKLALGITPKLPRQKIMTSICGYIGLSEADSYYQHILLRNPMFSHVMRLNPCTSSQATGCLAYQELLFFSCKTEHEAMSEFSKIANI